MGRAPALIVLALAACGDDATHPDAHDVDADLIDFVLDGTYLDWDSTTATPCPIAAAKWWAHYDDSRVAFTDASGVFHLRLASYLVELDTEPPMMAAACASSGTYGTPVNAIIPPAVFYAGGHFVARGLTDQRRTSLYAAIGAPFDPTRGALLVHIDGAPRAVAISSAHATAQAFDGATWTAGSTGTDVYFPNIDLATPAITTVTVTGAAIGTGSVPLYAGKIMAMTIVAP